MCGPVFLRCGKSLVTLRLWRTARLSRPESRVQSPPSNLKVSPSQRQPAPVSTSQRQPAPASHLLLTVLSPPVLAQSTKYPLPGRLIRLHIIACLGGFALPPPPSRSARPRVCPDFCLAHDFRRLLWGLFFFSPPQSRRQG